MIPQVIIDKHKELLDLEMLILKKETDITAYEITIKQANDIIFKIEKDKSDRKTYDYFMLIWNSKETIKTLKDELIQPRIEFEIKHEEFNLLLEPF